MGTGRKLDPTKFGIVDISKTHTDPLAKAVRLGLRKRGITKGVKCVFSPETPAPMPELVPGGCDSDRPDNLEPRRAPGSISFVPSVAGLVMAGVVVNDLLRR